MKTNSGKIGLLFVVLALACSCNFSRTSPGLTSWAVEYETPDSTTLSQDLKNFVQLSGDSATTSKEMVAACSSGASDAVTALGHPKAPQPDLAKSYVNYLFLTATMFNKCVTATRNADSAALQEMNSDLAKLKIAQGAVNKEAIRLGFTMRVEPAQ
jgi:hypothetical protein